VVIGDAVASFNPIYGQGMSVAALDSLAVHHALSDGITGVGPRVFDLIKPVIHEAWRTAVGNDFIFDETTGPKPFATDLLNTYASRLVKRAHDDGMLTEAFLRCVPSRAASNLVITPADFVANASPTSMRVTN